MRQQYVGEYGHNIKEILNNEPQEIDWKKYENV